MELVPGVYETLISRAIEEKLNKNFPTSEYLIDKVTIDSAESNKIISNYLANSLSRMLKENINEDRPTETITEQIEKINSIFKFIEREWEWDVQDDILSVQDSLLKGIYSRIGLTENEVKSRSQIHPVSGYRASSLFTGATKDISIDQELIRDIQTSDEIDILVSFIKFSGLRLIIEYLREFVSKPTSKLRVITTTYMGASDVKAIKRLFDLKNVGNVEIKASYNSNQERLHAKAYIFKRNNGFDTAYIGSSNISYSAMTKGLEWNMRITNIENHHIIDKAQATFDNYWNSEDFEPINSDSDISHFSEEIYRAKQHNSDDNDDFTLIQHFERKTHQIKVLDALKYERDVMHSYKNLIIAATGTGKTVMSAFDFKDFNSSMQKSEHRNAKLLFIVHRDRILKQARYTFRSVLSDQNFGELWVGDSKPSDSGNLNNLFVSIQTLNANLETFKALGNTFYDYIIIDEVHHSKAGSYRVIFDIFKPKILLGLTATPERMDGQAIKPDFNDRYAAEIRLTDAIDQGLLCPFDYFCVSDNSVDLSDITMHGGAYDKTELTSALCIQARANVIEDALQRYLTNTQECKAICFCASIKHAEYVANMLSVHHKAASLTSQNKSEQESLLYKLVHGDIQYLCVADMLNEGFDIPEIDTVLFLRPTESLTIFIQQLGRGLRTADGKTVLTVLDFVAQANKNYNYESRFRALVGRTESKIRDEIINGFTMLPKGCTITMEKRAQEHILRNITSAIFNFKRFKQELPLFEHNTGRELTIENFTDNFELDIRTIYQQKRSWSLLKRITKTEEYETSPALEHIERGFERLLHINSYEYLGFIQKLSQNNFSYKPQTSREAMFIKMFYYTIFDLKLAEINKKDYFSFKTELEAIQSLGKYKSFKAELNEIIDYKRQRLCQTTEWLKVAPNKEIELYGCYSFDEIMIALKGDISRGQRVSGVINLQDIKTQLLFVTINKSDFDYSPTTLYKDYAIDKELFHWQSQNSVKRDSEIGKRYIEQKNNNWKYLLFIRDTKRDSYDFSNAYYCMGFLQYQESHGECPMNIIWKVEKELPGFILEKALVG